MFRPLHILCTFLFMTLTGTTGAYAQTERTPGTGTFALIKSNAEVVDNGRYILVNTAYGKAMKAYDNKYNNYRQVTVTLNEAKDIITDIPEGTAVFNLKQSGSKYSFRENTNNIFMAITTSNDKNNYLKTYIIECELTKTTINIEDNGDAAIQFNGNKTYTHNVLRYNYNGGDGLFSCYTETNQGLQKPVQLFREVYIRTVTPGQYGTLCLPYSGTFSGAKFYTIEGKQMDGNEVTSVSLVEADTLLGGIPYIFLATDNLLEVKYKGYEAEATSANGLVGSYAATDVAEGMYLLSQNTIKRCGKNSKISTNRCYIDMDNVPVLTPSSEARVIRFGNTTDGIGQTVTTESHRQQVYDLNGRSTSKPKKGLYIVNGKKIRISK